jgi:adhesin transport system membrane fusion protein
MSRQLSVRRSTALSVSKVQPLRTRRVSMTTLMFIGLCIFLGWASIFQLDQTVRAQGQVIPISRTQIIQAADGGVLSQILVHEGQIVKAGQTLAVLERDRSNASFQESRAKDAALAIALARAQAEASGTAPNFGTKFKEFPQFVAAQQALYTQRKLSMQEELATLRQSIDMAQEELRMHEALMTTGDTSQLEVMRAKRQVAEIQGRMSAVRNKYMQDARQEASKLAEDLASSRYKVEERQDILGHTELTAPVDGVVKYMKVTTIGGVLRAGDELMQISPTNGEMIIEVKVNPVDIGQLKVGLPASVKLDAFDYSVYGNLQGTLSYISSDTLTDQGTNGQATTYYRAQIRLDEQQIKANVKLADVALKPGMTSTVDIRTNSRSVLKYMTKPIFKAFSGALNER